MNNIPEIQSKLARLRDSNEIKQLLDTAPDTLLLKEDVKAILRNACFTLINKLIKHLDSKRPSKSSVSNVMNLSFYKLHNLGINGEALTRYCVLLSRVMQDFEGAFSNRLNVKSQEFLDLEDCEPF